MTELFNVRLWISLAAAIVGLLLAVGVLPSTFPQEEFLTQLGRAVGPIMAIISALYFRKRRSDSMKSKNEEV